MSESRSYDRYSRDPESRRFYNSAAWKLARTTKMRATPICERCQSVVAAHVHHIKPLRECSTDEKIAQTNLMSVCVPCHNAIEAEASKGPRRIVRGTLTVVEDATYHYDEQKAERPIRFIEALCKHYEGRFAGQPFRLLDWQKQLIRTLFGWVHRETGLRRFRELYLITAKGAGKTPMLAAIGLYMLLADGEAGAHVVSMASSFEQANLTFSAAKNYVNANDQLRKHRGISVKQYAIDAPALSKWTTISGKPNGRSGPRPSCVIADEAHEWPHGTAIAYDMLIANLFKRSQPLLLVATNAGKDRSCFAWSLHERAMKVLSGESDDVTLLPVIYEADAALDWRSEEAARQANPSIGSIITFAQIRGEQMKGEGRYRRLYLSQWITHSDRWLDLDAWDKASTPVLDEQIKGLPLYVSLDLSLGDDLCAATYVYPSPKRFYVRSRFWLPKRTGDEYARTHGIPFGEWAAAGAITLLDEPTIDAEVQGRIAADLIAMHKVRPITCVAYDRAYSEHCIEALKAAGIRTEKVGQGWGVATGSAELDRRLIEQSIAIDPSPVLRWCASNVERKFDERGNYWPIKPAAKGKYAGTRSAKIDGISALVTALTEARKHDFPRVLKASNVGALLI